MDENYYENLSKKPMGVGVLLFNQGRELLIVKPSYKTDWSIPGGVVDKNESPKDACLREIKEEIGLTLLGVKFLGVTYNRNADGKETLQFTFFGGELDSSRMANIKIDGQEIIDYKFLKPDEALPLLGQKLGRRAARGLEAIENNEAGFYEEYDSAAFE